MANANLTKVVIAWSLCLASCRYQTRIQQVDCSEKSQEMLKIRQSNIVGLVEILYKSGTVQHTILLFYLGEKKQYRAFKLEELHRLSGCPDETQGGRVQRHNGGALVDSEGVGMHKTFK